MNTTTDKEHIDDKDITQEEREAFLCASLEVIIQLFKQSNGVLPHFQGVLDSNLEKKFIDALGGKYRQGENPILFSNSTFYIYDIVFTFDEIKEIVIAYVGEEDIDFMVKISRGLVSDDNDPRFDFYNPFSNFPRNIITATAEKLRQSGFCRRIRDMVDRISGM